MALRYLRSRREEGFVSVISGFALVGIALGVATLIIVLAVWNGFQVEFVNRLIGFNGHIVLHGQSQAIANYQDLTSQVEELDGVTYVAAHVIGAAISQGDNTVKGVGVRGLSRTSLEGSQLISQNLEAPDLQGFEDGDDLIVGRRFAETNNLAIGDTVRLISPLGQTTPFGTIPVMKEYRVGGVYEVGLFAFDSNFVFMSIEQAQLFFGIDGRSTHIEVHIQDPFQTNKTTGEIYNILYQNRPTEDLRLSDWRGTSEGFLSFIETQRNVIALILALIILVAALNIISGLTLLVKDKSKDIAILRTMGATNNAVVRVFLMAGTSIGICGGMLGLFLGLIFSRNIETIRGAITTLTGADPFAAEIYFLDKIPAEMNPWETAAVVVFAILASMVATIIPAWRAGRTHPIEALRYEQ